MKVLILVGMQTDLLPMGAAEMPGSDELASIVNELMEKFDLVVAANFWLPASHLLFAANHPWRQPGQVIEINGYPTRLTTMFCVQNSFGAEFITGLNTNKISHVALMGKDRETPPRSAFFDAGIQRSTGLAVALENEGVSEVYIAGMPFEEEVKNTALDAVELGYDSFLVINACRGRSMETVHQALEEMESAGVKLITEI